MARFIEPQQYQNETAGELKNRSDIESRYTWNIQDIYSDESLWEEDFRQVEILIPKMNKYIGKLGDSAAMLLSAMEECDVISVMLERLHLYAMLAKDTDTRDTKYIAMDSRINSLFARESSALAFMMPEILKIGESKLEQFMEDNEALKKYAHFFNDLLRTKKHTLSIEQEELLASASEITGFPYDTFSVFTNADLEFPTIPDENGNDIQISHGRYQAALYSMNRNYRRDAFKAYYTPYIKFSNTLANLFNANLKSKIFIGKARKYSTALEASLDRNNIPVRVYETLIEMVSQNLQPMHRWIALKKKILKLDKFHPYDVYVGLFTEQKEKHYGYDESVNLVKSSLEILGKDYSSTLSTAFSNRWIDVYETAGKRGGAYSSGTTFGVHPYVLLNWTGLLNDVFTLAHEMGHNMHSFLTGLHQPYIYADYSIFLAEIASTFNEALLFEYLLKNVTTREEKLSLLERYLNNISATFYRQTMFAEFELKSYGELEKGGALTADTLRELYNEVYGKYMGPDMTIDTEEDYTWARVPHFYYNYYVFQYATGFAASEALAAKVKKEGVPAVEKYLNFLKAGKSDYPLTILKEAGVDMLTPEPTYAVAKRMNAVLDQIEELM